MGTPTTPGGPAGDDCLLCFAGGVAPRFINIQITGIEQCPCALHDIPTGFYTLQQSIPDPCTWEFKDDDHEIKLSYASGLSRVWIRDVDDVAVFYFWCDVPSDCAENFDNQYGECSPPKQCGYDGSVIVV
ncbi:hypothetical protein ES707_21832 [subsurface metagenome]